MVEITENIKLASIYIENGKYDEALDILDVELVQNQFNINAFYYKAIALIHKSDIVEDSEKKKSYLESGIQYFEKLIASKGENTSYDFSEAMKELKEAKDKLIKL
jgi:tetratricopeptide (TPR) repeat protein